MNPITPGYKYELADHSGATAQTLSFVERRPSGSRILIKRDTHAKMETVIDGTTTEEVLAALLHRMIHLNELLPCNDNAFVAHHLELALTLLNNRTADRTKRGVEGTTER